MYCAVHEYNNIRHPRLSRKLLDAGFDERQFEWLFADTPPVLASVEFSTTA
jgi:hypothetical protein